MIGAEEDSKLFLVVLDACGAFMSDGVLRFRISFLHEFNSFSFERNAARDHATHVVEVGKILQVPRTKLAIERGAKLIALNFLVGETLGKLLFSESG